MTRPDDMNDFNELLDMSSIRVTDDGEDQPTSEMMERVMRRRALEQTLDQLDPYPTSDIPASSTFVVDPVSELLWLIAHRPDEPITIDDSASWSA